MIYSLREMSLHETKRMIRYFLSGAPEFLEGMGVDREKLPSEPDWFQSLEADDSKPLSDREFFYLVWLANDEPIGHCNVNKIDFGNEAFMHLHIWSAEHRQCGCATKLLPISIMTFFERLELQRLYCEPFAMNPGPNEILPKLGFQFDRSYETTPSAITFPQLVNRWRINRNDAEQTFVS